jgi:diguanylate cyclase (GGDEF)-like protein/PAS domain S-box-containing protein
LDKNLRKRAEEALVGDPLGLAELSKVDLQFIIHELQVHQIELKIQNEELRRLQYELETSRNNFSNLYDSAPVCYCTLNHKGIILEANWMFSEMFGADGKTLIGQRLAHFIVEEDQDPFYLQHRQALKDRARHIFESRMVGKENALMQVQIRCIAAGEEDDQLRVIISDITQRKQIEEALRESDARVVQRLRELNALHTATTSLQSTLDLKALLTLILRSAIQAVPSVTWGMLYLVVPETGRLRVSALANSPGSKKEPLKFSSRNKYVTKALRMKQPLFLPEIKIQGDMDEAQPLKTRSALIAPLITNDQVFGAITLESGTKGAFSMSELELLESFAATAIAALHNANLHAQLQEAAITDFLTKQYNRRGFNEIGRREFQRFMRSGSALSVIMLDVDHFKAINDANGHDVGDQVLVVLGQQLRAQLRETDILGRYGGDEFDILLPETDLATALAISERLRQAICDVPIRMGDIEIPVTISQGVVQAVQEMHDLEDLLKKADEALYAAKSAGRNKSR